MSATRTRNSGLWLVGAGTLLLLGQLLAQGRAQGGQQASRPEPVASPPAPLFPADPSTACEPVAECLDCHEELREVIERPFPHEPAYEEDCTVCHSPHAARFPKLLLARERALCFACHRETVLSFQSGEVHTPVQKGQCVACHEVHGSLHEGLLAVEGNDLCLSCHEEKAVQVTLPTVHEPFADGECSDCHDPHASPFENQLVAPANSLCVLCHDPEEEALTEAHYDVPVGGTDCTGCHDAHASLQAGLLLPVAHEPFSEGSCDLCHATETATPRLLRATGVRLCAVCHEDYPPRDTVVHAPVAQGSCGACHDPHATRSKALLLGSLEETCSACHTELAERKQASRSVHPTSFEDGTSCDACHQPHSSKNELLLNQGGIRTCLSCHETERHGHPLGEDRIDRRTGKSITCVTCHDPHGTSFAYQLIGERTRGLCLECHDSASDG